MNRPVPGLPGVCVAVLHARFLRLLPKIEAHARICFRGIRCPVKQEDRVQECVALAWKWFLNLSERGKDVFAFPMAFASLERFTKPYAVAIIIIVVTTRFGSPWQTAHEGLSSRVAIPHRRRCGSRRWLLAHRGRPVRRLHQLRRQLPAAPRPIRLPAAAPQPRRPTARDPPSPL